MRGSRFQKSLQHERHSDWDGLPGREDVQYEAGLRRGRWTSTSARESVRANLQVSIAATRQRKEALDHVSLRPSRTRQDDIGLSHRARSRSRRGATAGPVLERPGRSRAI